MMFFEYVWTIIRQLWMDPVAQFGALLIVVSLPTSRIGRLLPLGDRTRLEVILAVGLMFGLIGIIFCAVAVLADGLNVLVLLPIVAVLTGISMLVDTLITKAERTKKFG